MKKLSLFLIVLLGTIFTTKAQLGQPELLDKIVSKVDNYYILESELNAQYFQYLS